jgi:SSS family transporter
MGSIVATETSTLSFIGVPAISFFGNLNFIQLLLGYIIGRFFVAIVFLPRYFNGELKTSYQFLESHFSPKSRKIASGLFLATRILGDGVRLYATAIPLFLLTGWSNELTIIVIILVTIVFTLIGGIRAVVWTDFVQLIIYMLGAFIAFSFLMENFHSFSSIMNQVPAEKKLMIDFSFSLQNTYSFWAALVGGSLLSISSHGTDQLIVQRILTAKNLKDGQKALIGSGFVVFFQLIFFLVLGLLLFTFYQKMGILGEISDRNQVLPYFIINYLPEGITGLIIASIFAAAISTLSSSLNSMASATIFDFIRKDERINMARIMTIIVGLSLTIAAFFFQFADKNVVDLALGIASILYGGILAMFLIPFLQWKLDDKGFIYSLFSGVLTVGGIWLYQLFSKETILAWTFFIPLGMSVSLLVARFLKKNDF